MLYLLNLKKKLDKIFLSKFKNLSFIISPTTGLSHIDQNFLKKIK